MAIKIIVSTDEEKRQMIEASEHIHDSNVDTDLPMVNFLAHVYMNPNLIVVSGGDSQ